MTKLKYCPFCGKVAIIDKDVDGISIGCIDIFCPGSPGMVRYGSKNSAIEAWNKQVPPWRTIDEEMPQEDDMILVKFFESETRINTKVMFFAGFDEKDVPIIYDTEGYFYFVKIIKWCPIPEMEEE